jgi:hypothetical protein
VQIKKSGHVPLIPTPLTNDKLFINYKIKEGNYKIGIDKKLNGKESRIWKKK